jgi:HK97 family phage major capsid protein
MDPLDESFAAMELPAAEELPKPPGMVDRPALSGSAASAQSAFTAQYLRQGLDSGFERKSFAGTSDTAGGYAVPEEIDAVIARQLVSISPIRSIATVVQTGSAGYRKLVTTGGADAGWASETGARAETATPVFNEIVPAMGELYANPAASQAMLDDAAFDVEAWLASEIATEFARLEGEAFITGNGTNRPKGLLSGTINNKADSARSFGQLQYLATGSAGSFPAANPENALIDLVQALAPPYRQNAHFVMTSKTLSTIRKFKTSDGAFLWQPGLVAGQPDRLLGYPIVEAENMPDIGGNAYAVAFGNFKAGYLIAERSQTAILRDPFSHKPFVHFYATRRIGGRLSDSNAIKLLKFSAS